MRTYGPGRGNGRRAGGAAMSQECRWAIWVAFGVGCASMGTAGAKGAAVGPTVGRVVGRNAAGVGVPLPPWVLTLDKVAAAVGTKAAGVPLSPWVLTLDKVAAAAGTKAAGVGVPPPLWEKGIDGVEVPLPPLVSKLDKVAVVGRGACGSAASVGLPAAHGVSILEAVGALDGPVGGGDACGTAA